MNYQYRVLDQLPEDELIRVLDWWAAGTQVEAHMVTETPESLQASLLDAVFAYDRTEIVGAAGIFPARTSSGLDLYHTGMQVAELGSNYIHPEHRNHGIGECLLKMRLEMARQNNFFPVSVTSNKAMVHIFEKLGATPMDDKKDLADIRKQLCICKVMSSTCMACPNRPRSAWYF